MKVSAVEQMEELVTAAPLLVGSHLPTLVSELLALALPPSPLVSECTLYCGHRRDKKCVSIREVSG